MRGPYGIALIIVSILGCFPDSQATGRLLFPQQAIDPLPTIPNYEFPPLPIPPVPGPHYTERYHPSEDRQNESHQSKTFWERTFNDPTAFFTLWVAIFTAVLSVSTVFLYLATRKSTDAATRAAEVAENALTTVERAYVSVNGLGVENLHGTAIAKIAMRNAGNLPAQSIRWVVDSAIVADAECDTFHIREDIIIPSTNVLAPRSEMVRFYDNRFDRRDVEAFERGDSVIYVWGIVYYIDGFQTWRWTRFCHRYNNDCITSRDVPGFKIWDASAERVRQHQYGNGTDEDAEEW